MFKRSQTDSRRVLVIDYAHLAWAYAFSRATALSHAVVINGVTKVVDTTIPAYTIKAIHRWSEHGYNPTAVCFDTAGSAKSRKGYFAKHRQDNAEGGQSVGYKARRESQDSRFYEGINITFNELYKSGVSCYRAEKYEADDLVKACVDRAKIDYPDLPIDVITGDHDLVPLVDEQVSVFLRSTKTTYAESKDIEKVHYVQITPRNYQGYLESLTAYKSLTVPYNTVLLMKLLRGDKSDEIPGKPDWKPKKVKGLIADMQNDGVDLGNLFRYGNPIKKILYKDTREEIPQELVATTPKEQKVLYLQEPAELTNICNVLSNYVTDEDIQHIRWVYNGINLNGAFTDLGVLNRTPAVLTTPVKGYDMVTLAKNVSLDLAINLPIT